MEEIKGTQEHYEHDHESVDGIFYCPGKEPGTLVIMEFDKWPIDGTYHFAYRVGESVNCERMVAERLLKKKMFVYKPD